MTSCNIIFDVEIKKENITINNYVTITSNKYHQKNKLYCYCLCPFKIRFFLQEKATYLNMPFNAPCFNALWKNICSFANQNIEIAPTLRYIASHWFTLLSLYSYGVASRYATSASPPMPINIGINSWNPRPEILRLFSSQSPINSAIFNPAT